MRIQHLSVILSVFLSLTGAVALPTAPEDFGLATVLPNVTIPGGQIGISARTTAVDVDGRDLRQQEEALALGLSEPLALGAGTVHTVMHGHTRTNRYDAQGWNAWMAWRAGLPGDGVFEPGLLLFGEYRREDTTLQAYTATSSSFNVLGVTQVGAQAALLYQLGRGTQHLRVGGYSITDANGYLIGTTWLYGIGMAQPITSRLQVDGALTGLYDLRNGHHTSVEAVLGARYTLGARTAVRLSGRYYPRGIPLAGTPISTASAVGSVIGDTTITDRLRGSSFGLLSLDVTYQF